MLLVPYKVFSENNNFNVYKCFNISSFEQNFIFGTSYEGVVLNQPINVLGSLPYAGKSSKEILVPKEIDILDSDSFSELDYQQKAFLHECAFDSTISLGEFRELPPKFFDECFINHECIKNYVETESVYLNFVKYFNIVFDSFLRFKNINSANLYLAGNIFNNKDSCLSLREHLINSPYYFSLYLDKDFKWTKEFIDKYDLEDNDHDKELASLIVSIIKKESNGESTVFAGLSTIHKSLKFEYDLDLGSTSDFEQKVEELNKKKYLKYLKSHKKCSSYFSFFVENALFKRFLDSSKDLGDDECVLDNVEAFASYMEEIDNLRLSETQKEALYKLGRYRYLFIAGKAGTGKTTLCRAIESSLRKVGCSFQFLSTTGRSCKALEKKLDGSKATTVHSYLGYNGRGFRGIANKKPCQYYIIDEFGMCDSYLAFHTLLNLPKDSKIIFIGDTYQLPPVAAGCPMSAVIESDLFPNVVKLSTVYRQGVDSDVFKVAQSVLKKDYIHEIPNSSTYILDTESNSYESIEQIRDLVKEFREEEKDFCVLSPVKKGSLGVISLNKQLKEALNPTRRGEKVCNTFDYKIAKDDRVMMTRNNWTNVPIYCNGDLGTVEEVKYEKIFIQLDNGKKIKLSHKEAKSTLSLAYAMTIHKSQGCEFDSVILVMKSVPNIMLNLNLLYTAVTRTKNELHCFMDKSLCMDLKDLKFMNKSNMHNSWIYFLTKLEARKR